MNMIYDRTKAQRLFKEALRCSYDNAKIWENYLVVSSTLHSILVTDVYTATVIFMVGVCVSGEYGPGALGGKCGGVSSPTGVSIRPCG